MWSGLWSILKHYEIWVVSFSLFVNLCFLVSFNGYINDYGSYYPETPRDLAYSVYKDNSFLYYTVKTFYKNGVQTGSLIEPVTLKVKSLCK